MPPADTQHIPPLELDLPVDPRSAGQARHAVAALLDRFQIDGAGVILAVSEAVTNAILHAYRDGRHDGLVRLRAGVAGGELAVEVADDGVGMSPRTDSPGLGLGLPTISAVADAVEIEQRRAGTTIRMRFALH